jgi:hypothetical protein
MKKDYNSVVGATLGVISLLFSKRDAHVCKDAFQIHKLKFLLMHESLGWQIMPFFSIEYYTI